MYNLAMITHMIHGSGCRRRRRQQAFDNKHSTQQWVGGATGGIGPRSEARRVRATYLAASEGHIPGGEDQGYHTCTK